MAQGAWLDPNLCREEGQDQRQGRDSCQNGCWGPQARSGLSPGMQPAAFTPTQKAASGRLDPPSVALFGPSVVTQVQRPDPRASGAMGVARPKPGPGRGAGPERRDVTPARMAARCPQAPLGLSPGMQPAAFTPTQKAASGRLDHTPVALFGPSVVTQVQRPDPWPVALGAWLDSSLGQEEGRGQRTGT